MAGYLLSWIFFIVYYGIGVFKNYCEGKCFDFGRNPVVALMTPVCLVLASFLVPDPFWRLMPAALFLAVILFLLMRLERHNRAHYSGEDFLFRYREIRKWKGRLFLALGVIVTGLVLSGFLEGLGL